MEAFTLAQFKFVSIPNRDLWVFQLDPKFGMMYCLKVSIPNRDLWVFQPLAPETLVVFGFQGTFPTHKSNHSRERLKKQPQIPETLAL
jgi:hypothetical protein